jgi:hypothetical protein
VVLVVVVEAEMEHHHRYQMVSQALLILAVAEVALEDLELPQLQDQVALES